MTTLPRYPIYIPSKGRYDNCYTANFLRADGVPFYLVVEPQEADAYGKAFGADCVLVLPFSDLGQGSIPARNWIKDHATAAGHERHWQLDDNMRRIRRWYRNKRIACDSSLALRVVEDFSDRYDNVALSGLNYVMFGVGKQPAFHLNCRVYSCTLVNNAIPYRWRGRYNEDTDICLQALAGGWCTVLINAFLAEKVRTMQTKGGNTTELYSGDGRLRMARSLERMWPGVVETSRRFQRPQHVVKDAWRRFDTPLRLKPGVQLSDFAPVDDYGMTIARVSPTKSANLDSWARDLENTPDTP